jgi:hypothetical protein
VRRDYGTPPGPRPTVRIHTYLLTSTPFQNAT